MKKFRISAVLLVVVALLCGAGFDAAAAVRKTRKKARTTQTTRKKAPAQYTSLADFVKACKLVGKVNDEDAETGYGQIGERRFALCSDAPSPYVPAGSDKQIYTVISFKGDFVNPDYLVWEDDEDLYLLDPTTLEMVYKVPEITRVHSGFGPLFYGGEIVKIINGKPSGQAMNFEMYQ